MSWQRKVKEKEKRRQRKYRRRNRIPDVPDSELKTHMGFGISRPISEPSAEAALWKEE
jgi:hypothetical protein